MAFGNDRKMDQVLKSITPLIEKIADDRVMKVMDKVQRGQIKQYEEFFAGQGERLDAAIKEEITKQLKEAGVIKK